MTEKRFWSEYYSVGYYTEIIDNDKELKDVPNPKKNLSIKEAVDLLNELHEENQQYHEWLDALKEELSLANRDNTALENENKKLKSLLKECKHELTSNTGLSAFDKCASYIGYVEVFDKDIIDLDYSELLEKINKVDLE